MCISFSFLLLTKIPWVAKFTTGPPERPEGQDCLVLWSVSSFSQIMFLLEKQNWRIKSWISTWSLKPVLEYNGSLNLFSCFTNFLGKDIEIDSNCNWAWYRTVVSCSFICSTAIKLRWFLGRNHSPGYLSPSTCTYSCLLIFIHCTKRGKRGALLWYGVMLALITGFGFFFKKKKNNKRKGKEKRTTINLPRMSLNTFF